jgi:hypothetical protein
MTSTTDRGTLDRTADPHEQPLGWFSGTAAPEFGPNDWFVEEKYLEYLADPSQVDPIWRDFFAQSDPTRPALTHRPAVGPRTPLPGWHSRPGRGPINRVTSQYQPRRQERPPGSTRREHLHPAPSPPLNLLVQSPPRYGEPPPQWRRT